jgi:hypothetical protein
MAFLFAHLKADRSWQTENIKPFVTLADNTNEHTFGAFILRSGTILDINILKYYTNFTE